MQASRRTWRLGQTQDVAVYYAVYRDTMEHRAASLVGQKLAAAQLIYGDQVEGALVQQSDSGHGFLADLARSVIADTQVADLSSLFRSHALKGVENGNGNGNGHSEHIGARPLPADAAASITVEEIAAGVAEALGEPSRADTALARQMALF